MPATHSPESLPGLFRRILAGGCAALVLALTIFAASPKAHDLLHGADPEHTSDGDGCAVVLFASGISLAVGPIAVTPPTAVAQGVSPVTAADVFLVSPRFLRQPERGPPVGWVS